MQWVNDSFPELHNDDALWAYAIHDSEQFMRLNDEVFQDAVLARLLKMGIFDWEEPNTRLHQATQAMRHSSALGSRLLSRILLEERKVRSFHHLPVLDK